MTEQTRRQVLAGVGSVLVAGCSTREQITRTEPETTPEPRLGPYADVSFGYAYSPNDYKPFVISARLESVTSSVGYVEATAVTNRGTQSAVWLVPEHFGEDRTLGDPNVTTDGPVDVRPGDWLKVELVTNEGKQRTVRRFEILPEEANRRP